MSGCIDTLLHPTARQVSRDEHQGYGIAAMWIMRAFAKFHDTPDGNERGLPTARLTARTECSTATGKTQGAQTLPWIHNVFETNVDPSPRIKTRFRIRRVEGFRRPIRTESESQ